MSLIVLAIDDSEWTYTAGEDWWGGWVGFELLLIPTFFANLVTLILVTYSPRLNRSSASVIIRYLCIEDGLFSLFCLIQCALNLSQRRIVGGFIACETQAIYALFFMLATGYTLCCVAYNSEQKISFKPGLSSRTVFFLHLAIWSASALIAFLSSLILAEARIMPSSTYCLVSLVSLQSGLVFYIPGVFVIGSFLSHRYFLIYLHVTRESGDLVSAYAAQKVQAQKRQITVAKRMFVIVCGYFLCALPTVVTSIVEIILQVDAPPEIHLWAGHMIHVNSLLNPLLYVWMNSATRAALWELFGYTKPPLASPSGPACTTANPAEADDVNDAQPDDAATTRTTTSGNSSTPRGGQSKTQPNQLASKSAPPLAISTRFLAFSSKAFHMNVDASGSTARRASLAMFDSPTGSKVVPVPPAASHLPPVMSSPSALTSQHLPLSDSPRALLADSPTMGLFSDPRASLSVTREENLMVSRSQSPSADGVGRAHPRGWTGSAPSPSPRTTSSRVPVEERAVLSPVAMPEVAVLEERRVGGDAGERKREAIHDALPV